MSIVPFGVGERFRFEDPSAFASPFRRGKENFVGLIELFVDFKKNFYLKSIKSIISWNLIVLLSFARI